MIVEVVMFGSDDEPVAKALVEAASLDEAHGIAIKLIQKQYPDIDPQKYNQTISSKILFRSATN